MSKDATDFSNAPMPEETPATQTSLDLFNSFLNAPVTKLDADEYVALDQDGVTEGLIGSGNMNFLMMQAGQTNESMSNANPFDLASGDNALSNASNLFSPNTVISGFGGIGGNGDTNSDRTFDRPDDFRTFGEGSSGAHNNNMTGSLSALNLAANTQSVTPFSDTSSFASSSASNNSITSTQTATGGNNGIGQDGMAGTPGTPGSPGAPGAPGEGGGATTVINNIIDNTTHLGDSVTNLIDNTVHNTTDILTTTINDVTDILNNTTNNTTDLISTIVNDTTSIVNNTVNNVTDIINNLLGGDHNPIGLDLNATLDNLTHLNLDLFGNGNVFNVINQTIDLSPVLTPVTNIIGDIVSDVNLHVLLDPLHYDSSPTDTDLHIGTGLDVLGLGIPNLNINIPLDPVEALVGDIDLNLDIAQTLADLLPPLGGGGNSDHDLGLGGLNNAIDLTPVTDGLSNIINPVEDLLGDLDIGGNIGLGLLGTDIDAAGAPDTDLTIPLDIGLIDSPLFHDGLSINLDMLEALTGDIDVNLTGAIDLLGSIAAPLIDAEAGGTGTHNILSNLGDVVSDLAGGLLSVSTGGDHDLGLATGIDILDHSLLENGLAVVLDPVENLLGDIDIGGTIGLDLLGTNTGTGADTDITIPLDLGLIDNSLLSNALNINLDPLEALTGDIDIDLGVAGNLLGDVASPIFDALSGGSGTHDIASQIGDAVSHIADSLLPTDNAAGDSDLTIGIDLGLLDTHLVDNITDVSLDHIEAITGDIDIGSQLALGLLGSSTTDVAGANDLNIGLGDLGLGNIGLNLDPVEAITGNIDLGLNISSDLIGNLATDPGDAVGNLLGNILDTLNHTVDTAVGLLDNTPVSGTGLDVTALSQGDVTGAVSNITSWTESILPDAGSALGGGIIDTVSQIPDVISSPIVSLPAAVAPVVTTLLGGILGGGSQHHGGLFG